MTDTTPTLVSPIIASNTLNTTTPVANVAIDPLHGPVQYYCDFDANNNVKGFYNSKINVGKIPSTAIEITEEQWDRFIKNQPNYKWDGSDFVPYTRPITTTDLLNYSSDIRRGYEEGGITLNGTVIATDRSSQQMIQQTISSLVLVPNLTINWKNPDGSFTVLTADQIKAIGSYVAIYVASTFTAQMDVTANIENGTIKAYADIDAQYANTIVKSFTTSNTAAS